MRFRLITLLNFDQWDYKTLQVYTLRLYCIDFEIKVWLNKDVQLEIVMVK